MAYSFSYRGERAEDYGIDVLNVNRSILPPASTITTNIPGRDGELFVRNEYGMRTIEVEILVRKQNSMADFMDKVREIAEFLDHSKGLGELVFDDETDKYYEAVVSGDSGIEQIKTFGRGTITFVAPDPFARSFQPINVGFENGTTGEFVAEFELVGSAEVYPHIWVEVFNSGSFLEIRHVQRQEKIRLEGLGIGEWYFNNEGNSIYLDHIPEPLVGLTLDSDFFKLKKGTNTIIIETDADPVVTFMAYWPKWL